MPHLIFEDPGWALIWGDAYKFKNRFGSNVVPSEDIAILRFW